MTIHTITLERLQNIRDGLPVPVIGYSPECIKVPVISHSIGFSIEADSIPDRKISTIDFIKVHHVDGDAHWRSLTPLIVIL